MVREHYTIDSTPDYLVHRFQSHGNQGVIDKLVVFEELEGNRYNLAFGDVIDGKLRDEVISNNFDLVKTVSTIAITINLFFQKYPSAILEFDAVDEKRLKLYNRVMARRFLEIEKTFHIKGIRSGVEENYQLGHFYYKFVIETKADKL